MQTKEHSRAKLKCCFGPKTVWLICVAVPGCKLPEPLSLYTKGLEGSKAFDTYRGLSSGHTFNMILDPTW